MDNLGTRLASARMSAGLSQAKLATLLGVTRGTITRWENGTRAPSDEDKHRLSRTLNVSIAYLMGETDEPRPVSPATLDAQKKPASEETGELVELTLPSGRMIRVTQDQLDAYQAWDRKRNLDTTVAIAATLGIPLSDLVPAGQIDKCPTETHRNLVGLLKALAVADPQNVRFAARGGIRIEDVPENDAKLMLEAILSSANLAVDLLAKGKGQGRDQK